MTANRAKCCKQIQLPETRASRVAAVSLSAKPLATVTVLVVLMTAAAVRAGAVLASSDIASSINANAASASLGLNDDRHARQADGIGSCAVAGCSLCSDTNGCLRCEPSHYLVLIRDFMQQRGACALTCPIGYYPSDRDTPFDVETPQPPAFKKCQRCNVRSCAACHSRHYCTRCIPTMIAFRGQCYRPCTAVEEASNVHAAECPQTAECSAGPWSPWATSRQPLHRVPAHSSASVVRKLSLVQSRSRDVLVRRRSHSGAGDSSVTPCVATVSESRVCSESYADACDLPSLRAGEGSSTSSPPPPPEATQGATTVTGQVGNEYKPRKRKSRPGAKPPKPCGVDAESDAAAQPRHRVRHGGGGRGKADGDAASAVPAGTAALPTDADKALTGRGCDAAPPPAVAGRSTAVRPVLQSWTSEAEKTSQQQRTDAIAFGTRTPPPIISSESALVKVSVVDRLRTTTPLETSALAAEPPAADPLSSDYYGYYMRLAKQLLRAREAALTAASPKQPRGSG